MAPVDGYNSRIYWAIGNLAGSVLICLPLTWGLAREQSLKFLAAATGTALAVNCVRLTDLHDRGAPTRAAWQQAGQMVSAAWIEDISLANLPPSIQRSATPVYAANEPNYYLPPQSSFQSITEEPQDEAPPERGGDRKMPNLSAYNAVLIYGVPGSGKTTLSEQEVERRLSLGHEVVVLDPHAAYGKWKRCEIIGGGMNYKAIDSKLNWLFQEIKNRYSKLENEPNPHLPPLTVVAEEFTQWSSKVKNASELFWAANTDIRKVEIFVLFVNHTRTLVACGGAKGAAALRDDNLLEVQLQGEANEQTGRATPLFQALVKMPGKSLSERYLVSIDRISGKLPLAVSTTSEPQTGSARSLPQQQPENPGSSYGMRAEGYSATVAQILSEPGKLPLFSPAVGLPHEEKVKIAKIIVSQNLGDKNTILCLWGVASGGRNHHLYVEAKAMLERLIKGEDGNNAQ